MLVPSAHRSSPRPRRLVAIALVAVASAASLTGAALATKSADASTGAADLLLRVLRPGELRGYIPYVCNPVTWTVRRWAADNSVAAASLRRNGFVAGLREPLLAKGSPTRAVSTVALFSSSDGAQRELKAELADARSVATRFSMLRTTGIPAARAYVASTRRVSRTFVSFAIGRRTYVIAVVAGLPARIAALRERVLRAAHTLYWRLEHRP